MALCIYVKFQACHITQCSWCSYYFFAFPCHKKVSKRKCLLSLLFQAHVIFELRAPEKKGTDFWELLCIVHICLKSNCKYFSLYSVLLKWATKQNSSWWQKILPLISSTPAETVSLAPWNSHVLQEQRLHFYKDEGQNLGDISDLNVYISYEEQKGEIYFDHC